jgi:hypothetical protein
MMIVALVAMDAEGFTSSRRCRGVSCLCCSGLLDAVIARGRCADLADGSGACRCR